LTATAGKPFFKEEMIPVFKLAKIAVLVLIVLSIPAFASAQATPTGASAAQPSTPSSVFVSVGAGLVILGAGLGIGRIGGSTVESMARQPEVSSTLQTAMIISAALIEGLAFFALIICLLGFFLGR
jgi:F-type H+-transporting ATPase subunit c